MGVAFKRNYLVVLLAWFGIANSSSKNVEVRF
jgi:hypothetical protein